MCATRSTQTRLFRVSLSSRPFSQGSNAQISRSLGMLRSCLPLVFLFGPLSLAAAAAARNIQEASIHPSRQPSKAHRPTCSWFLLRKTGDLCAPKRLGSGRSLVCRIIFFLRSFLRSPKTGLRAFPRSHTTARRRLPPNACLPLQREQRGALPETAARGVVLLRRSSAMGQACRTREAKPHFPLPRTRALQQAGRTQLRLLEAQADSVCRFATLAKR